MKLTRFAVQVSPNEVFEPMENNEYPDSNTRDFCSTFNWRADSFIDYMTRKMRALKIETADFNMISIELASHPKPGFKLFEKVLSIEIAAEETYYRSLHQNDEKGLNEFFIGKTKEGLSKLYNQRNDIPYHILIELMDDYQEGSYMNQWIAKTKFFKTLNLKCELSATSSVQKFELFFIVKKDDAVIYTETVLETLPDPTFYYHEFKDIKLTEEGIAILRRNDTILTEIPIQKFYNSERPS